MSPSMKRFLAATAAVLSVIGVIAGLVIIWFSWSLNTPVTGSLVRIATAAERMLTVAEGGLARLDNGLSIALDAVTAVEDATRTAGQTIVETNLAFAVLERTVGDTLFPRIVSAHETITSLADTIVAFNETLEAANRLPFIEVPTISSEIQAVADRLGAARERVDEIRTALREIKEQKVSRPVAFITDRTGPIIESLTTSLAVIDTTRGRIEIALPRISALILRLPRIIDLISIALTLIMLWLIAAQAYVFVHAYEFLTGKAIDWSKLRRIGRST